MKKAQIEKIQVGTFLWQNSIFSILTEFVFLSPISVVLMGVMMAWFTVRIWQIYLRWDFSIERFAIKINHTTPKRNLEKWMRQGTPRELHVNFFLFILNSQPKLACKSAIPGVIWLQPKPTGVNLHMQYNTTHTTKNATRKLDNLTLKWAQQS